MMQPWKDLDGDEVNYFFPQGLPTSFVGNLPAAAQPVMVRSGTGNFYDGINFRYPGINVARDGRLGDRLETTDWNNVAPRFGIAWSPTSKWAIRAGYGIFYSQESGNSRFDLARNLSGRATTADSSASYKTGPPTLNWQNFYNPATLPYTLPSNGLTWGMDPNIRTPYSMTHELNVQRQLGDNTTLEVGYNGINSRKLQNLVNADPGIPCGTAVCAAGGSVTNPTNRAPFPAEAIGGIQYIVGNGDANYNGLGVKLTQRNFHGFTTIVAYTWSRALDFGSAIRGTDGDQFAQNPYCIKCEYGPSAFNADNRFSLSAIYDVPWAGENPSTSRADFLNAIVGGWQLNGTFTQQNGQPMDAQGWDAAGQVVVPNSNRLNVSGNPNLPRASAVSCLVQRSGFLGAPAVSPREPLGTRDGTPSSAPRSRTWISPCTRISGSRNGRACNSGLRRLTPSITRNLARRTIRGDQPLIRRSAQRRIQYDHDDGKQQQRHHAPDAVCSEVSFLAGGHRNLCQA